MSQRGTNAITPISGLRTDLEKAFPLDLVNELFRSYDKLHQDYFLADYRPLCIEAARFSEAAIRMLQHATAGRHIPLQDQIPNFAAEVTRLVQVPAGVASDSVRLLIPRTLQIIYDVRNKRNVGHIGGEVDENLADATLALGCCNWVLAEMTRIYHTGDITEAQRIVDSLVEIKIPVTQDFNGFLKVLDPDLSLLTKILVLLHHTSKKGASFEELVTWLGPAERKNLQRRLPEMIADGLLHKSEPNQSDRQRRLYITLAGERLLALNIRKSTIPK